MVVYLVFVKITTLAGDQVGKISKQWSGLVREMFTDADFFGITFPMDLDVKMKSVMVGAVFLIVSVVFVFAIDNIVANSIFVLIWDFCFVDIFVILLYYTYICNWHFFMISFCLKKMLNV